MGIILRPKNWPSLQAPPKPETKPDSRTQQKDRSDTAPARQGSRERRQPFYHTLDSTRGIDHARGWDLTEGRDHTKGTDRSKGRDRTGSFRS